MFKKNRIQQAQNETTSPDILSQLATSKDPLVRQSVASNPNTPVEVLEELGAEFKSEVASNPLIDLLFVEDCSSRFVRLTLARNPNAEAATLRRLINLNCFKLEDVDVLYAVAENPNTPNDLLKSLYNWQPSFWLFHATGISYTLLKERITLAVAQHPLASGELLQEMALAASHRINRSLPNNKPVAISISKLREGKDFEVLRLVAANPNTNKKTLEYLAGENCPTLHRLVASHPRVSAKAIDIINFRKEQSRNTLYLLDKLAKDKRTEVRVMIASYPELPLSLIKLLSTDSELLVLKTIAGKKQTPSEILEELAKVSHRDLQDAVLKNHKCSKKAQEIIALMRSRVPVKLPLAVAQELACDSRVKVRKKLVQNSLTPRLAIEILAQDSNRYIRNKAIKQLERKERV